MKKGWIQSNENGVYEDAAPNTLADQVYMDESMTQTVKQVLESSGGGSGVAGATTLDNTVVGLETGVSQASMGTMNTFCGAFIGNNLAGSMENTIVGHSAAGSLYSGSSNTFVGAQAAEGIADGILNVCIGARSGMQIMPGSVYNSVYIGADTMGGFYGSADNEVVIGAQAQGNGPNTVTLGNHMTSQLFCQSSVISMLSDTRVKEEVEPADVSRCLDAVKSLPVTRYKYKDFTGKHMDTHVTGFLADDVQKVFPKSVTQSDKYFPVLDANGRPVYEEAEEIVTGLDGNGKAVTKTTTRRIPKMFLMEQVKDLTMTEAVPTLWGAVQAMAARVEALEQRCAECAKA